MDQQNGQRRLISIWAILGALILAFLLFGSTLGVLFATRKNSDQITYGTAVLNIILAPTNTPLPQTATIALSPTALVNPGVIQPGVFVQVRGTGGDGLRLRFTPGLNGQIRLLGEEGEIFQVQDGPQRVDNFEWWYLQKFQDPDRQGWAVADFLQVVQNP